MNHQQLRHKPMSHPSPSASGSLSACLLKGWSSLQDQAVSLLVGDFLWVDLAEDSGREVPNLLLEDNTC